MCSLNLSEHNEKSTIWTLVRGMELWTVVLFIILPYIPDGVFGINREPPCSYR